MPTSSNVTEQGDRLLEFVGKSTAGTFLPGFADDEINRLIEGTPFALPSELRELYRWRNGQVSDGGFGTYFAFVRHRLFILEAERGFEQFGATVCSMG